METSDEDSDDESVGIGACGSGVYFEGKNELAFWQKGQKGDIAARGGRYDRTYTFGGARDFTVPPKNGVAQPNAPPFEIKLMDELLYRDFPIADLQRLQNSPPPPGAPQNNADWRVRTVVTGNNSTAVQVVWYVRRRNRPNQGFDEGGQPVQLASRSPNQVTPLKHCPWFFRALASRNIRGERPGTGQAFGNEAVVDSFTGHLRDTEQLASLLGVAQVPEGVPQRWWALWPYQRELNPSTGNQDLKLISRNPQGNRKKRMMLARWYQDLRPNGNPAYAHRWFSSKAQMGQLPCAKVTTRPNSETSLFEQEWEPASREHRLIWNPTNRMPAPVGWAQWAEQADPATGLTVALPWHIQRRYFYSLLDPTGATCDAIVPDHPTERFGFFREGTLSTEGPAGPWKWVARAKDGKTGLEITNNGKVDDKFRKQPWKFRYLRTWWLNTNEAGARTERGSGPGHSQGVLNYGPPALDGRRPYDFSPTPAQQSQRAAEFQTLANIDQTSAVRYQDPDQWELSAFAQQLSGTKRASLKKRRWTVVIRNGITPFGGREEFMWHQDKNPIENPDQKPGMLRRKIWCGNGVKMVATGGWRNPETGIIDDPTVNPTEIEATIYDDVRFTHVLRWKWTFTTVGVGTRAGIKNQYPKSHPPTHVVLVDLGRSAPTLFGSLRPKYIQIGGRDVQVRQLEEFTMWNRLSDRQKSDMAKEMADVAAKNVKTSGLSLEQKQVKMEEARKKWLDNYGPDANPDDHVLKLGDFLDRGRKPVPPGNNGAGTTTVVRRNKADPTRQDTPSVTLPSGEKTDRTFDLTKDAANALPFLREGDVVIDDDQVRAIPGILEMDSLTRKQVKVDQTDGEKRYKLKDAGGKIIGEVPPLASSALPNEKILSQAEIDNGLHVAFFATNPTFAYDNTNRPELPHAITVAELDLMNRPSHYQLDTSNPYNVPSVWRMANFVNYPQLTTCSTKAVTASVQSLCRQGPGQAPDPTLPAAPAVAPLKSEKMPMGIGVGPFINTQAKRDEYATWVQEKADFDEQVRSEQQEQLIEATETFNDASERYSVWYYLLVEVKDAVLRQAAAGQGLRPPMRWKLDSKILPGMITETAGRALTTAEFQAIGLPPIQQWQSGARQVPFGEDRGPDAGYVLPPRPSTLVATQPAALPQNLRMRPVPTVRAPASVTDNLISLHMKAGNAGGSTINWRELPLSMFDDPAFLHVWNKLCKFGWKVSNQELTDTTKQAPPPFVQVGQPTTSSRSETGKTGNAHNQAYVIGYAIYDKAEYDAKKAADPEAIAKAQVEEEVRAASLARDAEDAARNARIVAAREADEDAIAAAMDPRQAALDYLEQQRTGRDDARRQVNEFAADNGPGAFYPELPPNFQPEDRVGSPLTFRDWTDTGWWTAYCNDTSLPKPSPMPGAVGGPIPSGLNGLGGIRHELEEDFTLRRDEWKKVWNPSLSGAIDEATRMARLKCQPWEPRRHEADYKVYAAGTPQPTTYIDQQARCATQRIGSRVEETDVEFRARKNLWPKGADPCNPVTDGPAASSSGAGPSGSGAGPSSSGAGPSSSGAGPSSRARPTAKEQAERRAFNTRKSKFARTVKDAEFAKADEIIKKLRGELGTAERSGDEKAVQNARELLENTEKELAKVRQQRQLRPAAPGPSSGAEMSDDERQSALRERVAKEKAAAADGEEEGEEGEPKKKQSGKKKETGKDRLAKTLNAGTRQKKEERAAAESRIRDGEGKQAARQKELEARRQEVDQEALERLQAEQDARDAQRAALAPEADSDLFPDGLQPVPVDPSLAGPSTFPMPDDGGPPDDNGAMEYDSGRMDGEMEVVLNEGLGSDDEDGGGGGSGEQRAADDKEAADDNDDEESDDDGGSDDEAGKKRAADEQAAALAADDDDDVNDVDMFGDSDDEFDFGGGYDDGNVAARAEVVQFAQLERLRWCVMGNHKSPDHPGWYRRLGAKLAGMPSRHLHELMCALSALELDAAHECMDAHA